MIALEFYPEKPDNFEYHAEFIDGKRWKIYRRNQIPKEWLKYQVPGGIPMHLHPFWMIDGEINPDIHGEMTNSTKEFVKYLVDALNEKHVRDTRNAWP